jgi:hypothetical protein
MHALIIISLYIRTFLYWNVIGLQIAHLSRSSFPLIPILEVESFPFILF